MLIVEAPEDCGNAPRKRVIRDFIVALYSGQTPEVLGYLSENVNWKMIGSWDASDKTGVGHYLSQYTKIVHLRIGTIITHGTDCGIDGEITFESGQQAAFCHVLIFTGGARTAKIKAVRSYQIVSAKQPVGRRPPGPWGSPQILEQPGRPSHAQSPGTSSHRT